MRMSQIKNELDERGVSYRGLLEKSEFVDLLVDARARGVTAPPPSSGDGRVSDADDSGAQDNEPRKGGYDPSYKDVEVGASLVYWLRARLGSGPGLCNT